MARTIRYRQIADDVRRRLRTDEFGPGDVLASENELAAEHGASRVTVRRALELLRDDGLVDSRQGFGWFVAAAPVAQSLSVMSTIEAQLEASGAVADRQVLTFSFIEAPADVAEQLGVEQVLEVRRCNLADGHPFARVTVWCPTELAADMSRNEVESSTFVELIGGEFGGARQTIGAIAADEDDAEILRVPVGSPLLRARRLTYRPDGSPILYSEHVFAAHRTEFEVDLPYDAELVSPAGLRLVQ
ncbi:GntR family transcriptional regulator [Acidimicrobiaceae bacterium AH-315-P05]|nr:GntR family transcriptional regulator [Acidimicrobiaceae bacterium AH-315-P05]MBN4047525.1 GntR family transcriptional regulator [Acidimicrobiaceae bacterium AH-315-P05]